MSARKKNEKDTREDAMIPVKKLQQKIRYFAINTFLSIFPMKILPFWNLFFNINLKFKAQY